ncbi:MAG: GldG family protein [Lachnospiraceae bacterium]|nr:GldG family protein [Lachnospiraceae bacterium]
MIFRKKGQKDKKKVMPAAGVREKKALGALSATSIVLIIIVAVLANVLITKTNLSYDVTDNKIFTISEQSKKITKNLEKDVTIYFLSSKDDIDDGYLQIVNQYKKNSDHISVKFRDMELYPNFASQYMSSDETAEEGGMIVVCGEKGKYVSPNDYVGTNIDASGNYTTEVTLESSVTPAINYVTSENTPIIYLLTGHGELDFDSSFENTIEGDNYEFKELNLLTESSVPDDCAILLVNGPTSDLSSTDMKKVKKYMKNGGKLFYVCNTEAETLENFESLLDSYGIGINDGIVVESDSSMYMQGYPTYLLPTIESNTITNALVENSSYVLMPVSKGLTVTDDATALLSTSDNAYSKTNLESETIEKESGDIDGSFALAAEALNEDGESQVIVIGCPNMIMSDIDQYVSGSNSDFVSNCINALNQQDDKISIKAKEVSNETATYTTAAVQAVSFVTVIGIPVCILIIGLIVVILRRRSK